MFNEIINSVRAIHQIHPELRFQQIIYIAANKAGWNGDDLFYCEDSIIKAGFEKWLGEITSQ